MYLLSYTGSQGEPEAYPRELWAKGGGHPGHKFIITALAQLQHMSLVEDIWEGNPQSTGRTCKPPTPEVLDKCAKTSQKKFVMWYG